MIIYDQDTPLELEDRVDKDSLLYYTFYLKPPVWEANKEVLKGDVFRPTSPTGYNYLVTSSGITGATEPVWSTTLNSKTTDNTVIYKAIDNTSYLNSTGILNTTTSSFEVSDSIPITDSYFESTGRAGVQLGPVPSTVKKITLKIKMWVDNGTPTEEYDERSVIIKLTDR